MQQPDYILAGQREREENGERIIDGLVQHSIKRVKKKINDYILNNYDKLFFKTSNKATPQELDAANNGADAQGAAANRNQKSSPEQTVSTEDILTNSELLKKVDAELRLCEDRNKAPRELLQECVNELEEKGFLNCLEQQADQYLYEVRDQRDKLRHYISSELKTSQRGLSFESIHKRVSAAF